MEALITARFYGIEDQVIESLTETFPGIDWERQGTYFVTRMIQHGRRREEEMLEAAATAQEAGIHGWMASAASERQSWFANLTDMGVLGAPASRAAAVRNDWRAQADRIMRYTRKGAQPKERK